MKILHFILGKANPNRPNGVNHVIHGLCKYSALQGNDVKVVGVSKGMKPDFEVVQRDNFEVKVYNKFYGSCYKELQKIANEVDIVHLHSVWQHYNIVFANYLISIKKPYVVTIHSGLTDDRIKQSNYLIKLIYHKLFQKRIFDKASGLQAITKEEMMSISKHTDNKNIFYVQNGIDLDNFVLEEKTYNQKTKTIKIGYLGRFSIEKNIIGLIKAISILPENYKNRIKCELIGPLNKESEFLEKELKKLKLNNNIKFIGPLYGDEKLIYLKTLDFYVHTAFSDVVSIAVMEAFGSGLPCLITRTSQVSYFYKSNAFVMVEPTVEDIKRGLMEIIDKQEEWKAMSINSINLINSVFNWDKATKKMLKEYNYILKG
jgi:glycosyltransferase involved in cell wall biosynthesis